MLYEINEMNKLNKINKINKALKKAENGVPSNLVQQFRNYVSFLLTHQKSNGKISTFFCPFLVNWIFDPASLFFDIGNRQIELQELD